MKHLSFLTLLFAVISVVFFLLLIFLRMPFSLYPLMSNQDAIDILTPLVLIPIYWVLFRNAGTDQTNRVEEIVFMVLAGVWVLGHGMHLAANSINNLVDALAHKEMIDIKGTSIYELSYILDENLSHYLWHFGVVGFIALLIYREWRRPPGQKTIWWAAIPAGLLYGFTCFCIFLEGQTVVIGFPFVIFIVLVTLIWARHKLVERPVLVFFFISCLVALILLAGWGWYWRGFPQFSDVGII